MPWEMGNWSSTIHRPPYCIAILRGSSIVVYIRIVWLVSVYFCNLYVKNIDRQFSCHFWNGSGMRHVEECLKTLHVVARISSQDVRTFGYSDRLRVATDFYKNGGHKGRKRNLCMSCRSCIRLETKCDKIR